MSALAKVEPALVIDPGSTAHRVLLALRPGAPTEQATLAERVGTSGASASVIHLHRAGYIERTTGGVNNKGAWWLITAAGRAACPPRRGAFSDYHDFSTKPLGDLS